MLFSLRGLRDETKRSSEKGIFTEKSEGALVCPVRLQQSGLFGQTGATAAAIPGLLLV